MKCVGIAYEHLHARLVHDGCRKRTPPRTPTHQRRSVALSYVHVRADCPDIALPSMYTREGRVSMFTYVIRYSHTRMTQHTCITTAYV